MGHELEHAPQADSGWVCGQCCLFKVFRNWNYISKAMDRLLEKQICAVTLGSWTMKPSFLIPKPKTLKERKPKQNVLFYSLLETTWQTSLMPPQTQNTHSLTHGPAFFQNHPLCGTLLLRRI